MTLPLPWPQLSKDDPSGDDLENRLQENFDQVAIQFPITGAQLANDVLRLNTTGTSRVVAFGSSTVAFSASTVSAETTVTHGMVKGGAAAAPSAVFLTAAGYLSGTYSPITMAVKEGSVTTTQFVVQGLSNAALTRTVTFYWVAIG